MKAPFWFSLVWATVPATLLTGCLFKPATVSPRDFVLAPVSEPGPSSAPTPHLSVEIGYIKLPSYLLRDSLAVRTATNEIEYLNNALWAERLDHCFRRTLATDLSRLLNSDSVYFADGEADHPTIRISVNVQQFDVDTSGRGTLVAQWRITSADNNASLKSGCAQLAQTGAPPHGNPAAIAVTSSALIAEFSRELKQSILESAKLSQVGSESAAIH